MADATPPGGRQRCSAPSGVTLLGVRPFRIMKVDAGSALVVVPEDGAWGVIEDWLADWLLPRAGRKASLHQLAAELGLTWQALAPTVTGLFESGLVTLDGELVQPGSPGLGTPAEGPLFLMLRVTDRCTLACAYCYQGAPNNAGAAQLSSSDAQAALSLFAATCAPVATVLFAGGEALLRLPFLRECLDFANVRARAHAKRLRFILQTNGTLLKEDSLTFLQQNDVAVGVSYDGLATAHDAVRPFPGGRGSAARVLANIDRMLEAGIRVSLLTTVTADNVEALPEICRDLQRRGVDRVKFSLLTRQGRALAQDGPLPPDPQRYVQALNTVLDEIVSGTIGSLRIENIVNLMNQVLLSERVYLCDSRPCGAAGAFLAALPDGYLYPCETFPATPDYRIGAIARVTPEELVSAPVRQQLRTAGLRRPDICLRCSFLARCGGGCPSNAINDDNGMDGVEEIVCATVTAMLPEIMWRLRTEGGALMDYHRRHANLPGYEQLGGPDADRRD